MLHLKLDSRVPNEIKFNRFGIEEKLLNVTQNSTCDFRQISQNPTRCDQKVESHRLIDH